MAMWMTVDAFLGEFSWTSPDLDGFFLYWHNLAIVRSGASCDTLHQAVAHSHKEVEPIAASLALGQGIEVGRQCVPGTRSGHHDASSAWVLEWWRTANGQAIAYIVLHHVSEDLTFTANSLSQFRIGLASNADGLILSKIRRGHATSIPQNPHLPCVNARWWNCLEFGVFPALLFYNKSQSHH